ncbi:Fe-S oxidoreductase [Candidatus Methanoperedens nitroreducens]|uniref:Fe-S oxidoreductase n=1 Tax=Candidatus Methanoperedens nitratireducens TaxID=1392998 RepID=A0A062V014_9EURY|nr:(Fe-S)-binding protein [Candidatus Methanoperedens nitroreducens]KCZ72471.1 Fe-S oxidoreductase [Candidatus Methanoperedens nitroreducens]MDJ1423595.1 (Fe-S)-binding protein [Candidatus Methanoperedens sp.]
MEPEIRDAVKCSGCNVCLNECPVYEYYHCEAFGSRGKMDMLRLWQSGLIKIEDMQNIFEACTICKRCENVCTQGIETSPIFRDMRHHLIQNKIKNPDIEAVKVRINKTGSPYNNDRTIIVPDGYTVNRKDTLLWLGCTIRHLGLAERWLKFLVRINYMPVILETENCCGSFLNNCGYSDDYRKVMDKNIEILSQYKNIIALCPSCYSAFKNDGRLNNVFFITTVLDRFKDRLHISKSLKKPVLLFEPCHLRNSFPGERYTDVIQEIFNKDKYDYILSSDIFGAKCCGSGGGLFISSSDIPVKNTRRILEETDACSVVTLCPFCFRSFSNVTDDVKQVVDVFLIN